MGVSNEVCRIARIVSEIELQAKNDDWSAVDLSLEDLNRNFHSFFEDIKSCSLNEQAYAKKELQLLYERIKKIYDLAASKKKSVTLEGKKISTGLKMSRAYSKGSGGV